MKIFIWVHMLLGIGLLLVGVTYIIKNMTLSLPLLELSNFITGAFFIYLSIELRKRKKSAARGLLVLSVVILIISFWLLSIEILFLTFNFLVSILLCWSFFDMVFIKKHMSQFF